MRRRERISKPKRTAEQLRHTAIHEAGHAVIHRVVGMVWASIVPDYEEMTAGVAITSEPWEIYRAWEARGKIRGFHYESIMRGRIMGYMAGREAEIIAFGGKHEIGDHDDLKQIALMAEDAGLSQTYLDRLRPRVRSLLRRHWHKVEAVAVALLARQTLSGEDIDALMWVMTSDEERARLERIEIARQADRDAMAWRSSR